MSAHKNIKLGHARRLAKSLEKAADFYSDPDIHGEAKVVGGITTDRKLGYKRIAQHAFTALFFVAWVATFYWYQQGQIGGDAFFGSKTQGVAFVAPAFTHFLIALFAFISIHFSYHLTEVSS